jgi:hypothetical protein
VPVKGEESGQESHERPENYRPEPWRGQIKPDLSIICHFLPFFMLDHYRVIIQLLTRYITRYYLRYNPLLTR